MKRRGFAPISVTVSLLVAVLAATAPASAMTVLEAADRLNAITPQSIPTQTIRIGIFDGAAQQFHWQLPEGYPPNVPNYKKEEYGGPMKPDHWAVIKSFNVTYEFEIRNRPANFRLTLKIPTQVSGGQVQYTELPATLSGNIARVSFNPRSSAEQVVIMTGLSAPLRITPWLLPQLGAFVVPRLLVTIVYEPPGGESWARYGTGSTAGTVVSWGFARSNSDLVKTVNEDEMRENFVKGVTLGLQVLGTLIPAYKAAAESAAGALNTFNQILGNTTMQTTRTITSASSQFNGTFFSVDTWYQTEAGDALKYPGQGDVFVILEDVLFVYAVAGGRVALTPVGYRYARKLVGSQLDGYLPPALAAKYRELNPWFGGGLVGRGSGGTSVPAGKLGMGRTMVMPSRFKLLYQRACDIHAGEGNALTQGTVSGASTTTATTTTTVTKVTGHLASMLGRAGETSESLTYSTSRQTWNVNTQTATIYLSCTDQEGAFVVDIYLDTLMGTFVGVQGQPLHYVAGIVSDAQGRPLPNQTVTLSVGGQTHTAVSNAKGRFVFRLVALPSGSGSLRVGSSAVPVTYAGRPITNVKLVAGATSPASTVGQPGIQPKGGSPTVAPSPANPVPGGIRRPGTR